MPKLMIGKDKIREALTKFGYTTHPKGIVDHLDAEDDGQRVTLAMHAAAVRKDGFMPDYPIIVTYRWNQDKIKPFLEPESVREMTKEEAAAQTSVFNREKDQAKDEPWGK
jgi:hypothetical protein